MLAVGLIKNISQSSERTDEIASIPPVIKGQFTQAQLQSHQRAQDDSLLNNPASQTDKNTDSGQNYSNLATQNNDSATADKHYQDKEVYEGPRETKSSYSSEEERNKVLISQGDARRNRKQIIIVGVAGAILYGVAQGFMDVGEKVGLEKEDLKIY